MKFNKTFFFTTLILAGFGIVALIIFWIPSFFADEFSYVYVTLSNNIVTVTTNPSDLFEKGVSRWADVSATFKNDSQTECAVALQSDTFKQSFNLAPSLEHGVILPKGEGISITFCGVQKIIRVN